MSKITYADKSDISTSAVPATNKVVANDMNEIKTVVNTNDTSLGDLSTLTTTDKTSLVNAINEIKSLLCYNIVTDGAEVKVGYKVDNKDVYAKRYTIPNLNANVDIPHGLTNFNFIKWEAATLYQGAWRQLNYGTTSLYYSINIYDTYINYNSSLTLAGGSGVITLYYTKN